LKGLNLSEAITDSSRKARGDRLENQEIITGMLIHLLSLQPLKEGDNRFVKFTKGRCGKNINYSQFYKYFIKTFLNKNKSNFPAQRTVTDYLSSSYNRFMDDVTLK
jgi:hypothetical protein